jgi:SAM-dependent methyltransferase
MTNSEIIEQEKAKYEQMWTHDDYRTMSPGLYALEKTDLVEQFHKYGVHTILDAGCGSGKFMRRILEKHPEFSIRGFDIAGNCLDPWFAGRVASLLTTGCLWDEAGLPSPNDAVVCTDVMEHIPTDRVPDVLLNLRKAATKIVFLGIALFTDGFGPKVIGKPLHLTVKPKEWWMESVRAVGMEVITGAELRQRDGTPMWLHLLCQPSPANPGQT